MNRIIAFLFLMMSAMAVNGQTADTLSPTPPDSTQLSSEKITPDTTVSNPVKDSTVISLTRQDTLRQATDTTNKPAFKVLRSDLQYYFTIKDSAAYDSTTIRYFRLRDEWYSATRVEEIDTSLRYFHYTNPIYEDGRLYQSLGNTGLAAKNIVYSPNTKPGFSYGQNVFEVYDIDKDNLRFYNTLSPYSKIYYKSAPDKEQVLNFTHSQSVYKTVTLGMDIRIINSLGAFLNQESQDRRIGLTGHYISPNKRYTIAGYYAHNKYDIEENGGIADEEVFETNTEVDRMIYDINLQKANNLSKNAAIYIQHSFELSPSKELSDVAANKKSPFNFGRLSHAFKYYRHGFNYIEDFKNDTATVLSRYANSYKDTLTTHDTSFYYTVSNTFSWKNSRLYRIKKSLGFDFGLTHQFINFQDSTKRFNYNQFILHGRLSKNLYEDLKIGGEAEYTQGDLNENDFRISGMLENSFADELLFKARIDQISRDPDYFFRHYHSNHFRWDNRLSKENILRIGGEIAWNDIIAGSRYYLLTNYTFLNTEAMPEQAGKSFSVLQAYIRSPIKIGNFYWDTHLYFQIPSDDNYLRVPFAVGKTAFAYHNTLFKNALFYQVGLDVMYKDLYYADQYMPALRSFYNKDRKKIGNFFYGDAYVSIKIKRTKLILKYRHLNQGFAAYKYYDTPRYPLKDSGLEFALSWRFHD